MPPCISIIIPVYNAETTLREAVEAILNQSMRDFELLLVDDGSTDTSGHICRGYADRDSRVRFIRQANSGICAARNAGLCHARGKYVAFCDDDDIFLPDALHLLYTLGEETGADMVRGGYALYRQRGDGRLVELPHPPGTFCRLEKGGAYDRFLRNSGPQFVWNALYRRASLSGIRFDPRCRSGLEDFLFNAELYARLRLAVYDPTPVYRHYERLTSTSIRRSEEALRQRVDALAPWMEAEYRAACRWCGSSHALCVTWNRRKAAAVTFLMHQLRDMHANAVQRREAWRTLRRAVERYPFPLPLGVGGKQGIALWLFFFHLQWLYELWPNKEATL